jgi:Putative DNA-binding domain
VSETLRRLQEDFQGYLLTPDARMHPHVHGSAQVSAEERLAIYANAYRLRLLEALGTDYPGLHTVLGDDEFDAMGRAYIAAHPSAHFSLRWFGDRLSEFLCSTAPYSQYPVFAEMAAFEWAKSDAFDAADSAVASINDMAAIPPDAWPGLQFIPHPSLRRLDLRWNVPTVWKAIDAAQGRASVAGGTSAGMHEVEQRKEQLPRTLGATAAQEPPALEQSDYPIAWLVWRQDLLTYFRSLNVDEAWALDALQRGATFAAICDGLTEWIDAQNVAVHAAGLLKQWLTDGLISEIRVA